jgi:hypothetical protein
MLLQSYLFHCKMGLTVTFPHFVDSAKCTTTQHFNDIIITNTARRSLILVAVFNITLNFNEQIWLQDSQNIQDISCVSKLYDQFGLFQHMLDNFCVL